MFFVSLLVTGCTNADLAARSPKEYVTEFQAKSAPAETAPPMTDALGGGPAGLWFVDADRKAVARLDPGSNKVTMRVDLPERPTGVAPVGVVAWAVTQVDRTVRRVDGVASSASVVASLARETPRLVAVAGGNVWVADTSDQGQVFRYEPSTNRVRPPVSVGARITSIAANASTVVVGLAGNRAALIDVRSGVAGPQIGLDHEAREVAASSDGVAVAGEGDGPNGPVGYVTALDASGAKRWSVAAGLPLGHVAAGSGAFWWADEATSRIAKLAPADGKAVATLVTVPHPTSIAVGDGSVFCVAENGQKLWRVSASDGKVQARLRSENLLQSLVWG